MIALLPSVPLAPVAVGPGLALAGPLALAPGDSDKVVAAYGLTGLPFAGVVAGLFLVVLLRAQATYWLGRGVAAGTIRTNLAARVGRRLSGPRFERAVRQVDRWGPLAVTLSFLTVGVQTMVNLAAGLTRMPYGRYSLAMLPGCLAWAFIYATVGLAVFYTAVAAAAGTPAALAVLAGLLTGLVLLLVRRRRSGSRATAGA